MLSAVFESCDKKQWDGRKFPWFLQRNGINFQREGDKFFFDSTNDMILACQTWFHLGGKPARRN